LCQNAQIQAIAIDVLSFTIKQGLAHPLQVRCNLFLAFELCRSLLVLVLPSYRSPGNQSCSRDQQSSECPSCTTTRQALLFVEHSLHGQRQEIIRVSEKNIYRHSSRFVNPFSISFVLMCPIFIGFRMQPTPIALLQRWYSHVREKRPTRQDFLKSLVKTFQENPSYESSQVSWSLSFLCPRPTLR